MTAHLAAYLEPLLFAPAFLVVLWSIVQTARRRHHVNERQEQHQ